MKNRHNTQPQRPRDMRGGDEHIEINEHNVHARLNMLVGAINTVRLTCGDTELEKMMTQILRAGGVLVDDDKQ
jgi:hypothetical protein